MSRPTRRAFGAPPLRSLLATVVSSARRAKRSRPGVETLEDRALLSVASVTAPWASQNPVDPSTSAFVKFAAETPIPVALADLDAVGARTTEVFPEGLQLVELPPWADRDAALATLRAEKTVVYVEANQTYHIDVAPVQPNDPRYPQQYGLAMIDAPWAWGLTSRVVPGAVTTRVVLKGNRRVKVRVPAGPPTVQLSVPPTLVAVIDTGVDLANPDFAGRLWANPGASGRGRTVYGWNFVAGNGNTQDDNGHGTHVTGIIAAAGNNATGVVGVDWNARIMPLKTLDAFGNGSTDQAVQAVYFAVRNGAKVINASWGGDVYSQAMNDALAFANSHGAVFVTAAGNESSNNDTIKTYPASFRAPNELVVGAVDRFGNLADYSNYGATTVDLAAPGTSVLSTIPGGFASYSGSSMAAPFVTGTVALLAGLHPEMSPAQLVEQVRATVKPLASLAGKTISGGVVNPYNALLNRRTVG